MMATESLETGDECLGVCVGVGVGVGVGAGGRDRVGRASVWWVLVVLF